MERVKQRLIKKTKIGYHFVSQVYGEEKIRAENS